MGAASSVCDSLVLRLASPVWRKFPACVCQRSCWLLIEFGKQDAYPTFWLAQCTMWESNHYSPTKRMLGTVGVPPHCRPTSAAIAYPSGQHTRTHISSRIFRSLVGEEEMDHCIYVGHCSCGKGVYGGHKDRNSHVPCPDCASQIHLSSEPTEIAWRDEENLVWRKDLPLLARCFCCNAASTARPTTIRLFWNCRSKYVRGYTDADRKRTEGVGKQVVNVLWALGLGSNSLAAPYSAREVFLPWESIKMTYRLCPDCRSSKGKMFFLQAWNNRDQYFWMRGVSEELLRSLPEFSGHSEHG